MNPVIQKWKEDFSSEEAEKRIFRQTKLKKGSFLIQNWKEDFHKTKLKEDSSFDKTENRIILRQNWKEDFS